MTDNAWPVNGETGTTVAIRCSLCGAIVNAQAAGQLQHHPDGTHTVWFDFDKPDQDDAA